MKSTIENTELLAAFMQLTPQNQKHILAIVQALSFAQESAMNPPASQEKSIREASDASDHAQDI